MTLDKVDTTNCTET